MNPIANAIEPHAMELALEQAALALSQGEVPVGAVVICEGKVIAVGHNTTIGSNDPSAHAEIVALRNAANHKGNYRLEDCDLYVTLEPCIMCAGAILHGRIRHLVYGAKDPKTGAAGSVLNVFDLAQLNHQTQITSGVMEADCAAILQHFFKVKRQERLEARKSAHLIREDALRSPEFRFEHLSVPPFPSKYASNLPTLQGLRLHYLDVGQPDAPYTFLLLHASPAWGYAYYGAIPLLIGAGYRVVVPDFIGFGRSDKPKRESFHTKQFHQKVLTELMEHLCLQHVILTIQTTTQGWILDAPERLPGIERVLYVRCNGERGEEGAWLDAPFPDKGHRAGVRAFQKPGVEQSTFHELPAAEFVSPLLRLDEKFARFALHSVGTADAHARVNPC